jgi:hypothetical protein
VAMSMMLIDQYVAQGHYAKSNQTTVKTAHQPDLSKLVHIDFSKSKLLKTLFFLRGLPSKDLTLNKFINTGFILLEQSENEIVLGLIAQPWKFKGNIVQLPPEQFTSFTDPDYVKIAWNFSILQEKADTYQLLTETRIFCLSTQTKKRFSKYWSVIFFFSGVVRNEMLKLMKKEI